MQSNLEGCGGRASERPEGVAQTVGSLATPLAAGPPVPALPCCSCVSLGQVPNLSVLQCPHVEDADNDSTHLIRLL